MDLLELYAFVKPARPVVPTLKGLQENLFTADCLPSSPYPSSAPHQLYILARLLLGHLSDLRHTASFPELAALALYLHTHGWAWSEWVLEALHITPQTTPPMREEDALRVWRRLPQWEETAPSPLPSHYPVEASEARNKLSQILGKNAENRAGQADFSEVVSMSFQATSSKGNPSLILAEAGTGTGKTLGYLAPSLVWAKKNNRPVCISTYTRHLQQQIAQELARFMVDAQERHRNVVIRKGRENYLCLLNMEEMVNLASTSLEGKARMIALAFISRWAGATRDGDVLGGDLPSWFTDIFPAASLHMLTDRRGECIHGACPHYQTCFIEHSVRKARQAQIVIANHALVMNQAAWRSIPSLYPSLENEDQLLPDHYIFDEGHHLPEAADSAFSYEFSGIETAELRRWILGAEGKRSRAKGLERRLENLFSHIPQLSTLINTAAQLAARALPALGWNERISGQQDIYADDSSQLSFTPLHNNPSASEAVLTLFYKQVFLHNAHSKINNSFECDPFPLIDGLKEETERLIFLLTELNNTLTKILALMDQYLEKNAETLEKSLRLQIEGTGRSLQRRAVDHISSWIEMLNALIDPPPQNDSLIPPSFVSFIRYERIILSGTKRFNIGLYRHWLDPTLPFAATMAPVASGLVMTSATLRDEAAHYSEASWESAEKRLGITHFPIPAIRASLSSPFDYAQQTRCFIITDVDHTSPAILASAFRALFSASKGGALGLFTAINRLKTVYNHLAPSMEAMGIPLYAQHVHPMNNASLVDLFKTEIHSCLLGTDAMRDGVDIPGEALRMVVFERVPWPRPDILHRERRLYLSEGAPMQYDDQTVRLKLRQAFGRLIRSQTDKGVFILLDRRMPSRLLTAFPEGANPQRTSLAEAITHINNFLEM